MGIRYVLRTVKNPHSNKPHIYIEMVAGRGPDSIRMKCTDMGIFHSGSNDSHKRIGTYRTIINQLNSDLSTFKTRYEGPRHVTGEKVYSSIILSAILHMITSSFTAFDILLSAEATQLFILLIEEDILCLNYPYGKLQESLFLNDTVPITQRENGIQEICSNRKAILQLLKSLSEVYLDKELVEVLYRDTLIENHHQYAYDVLMESGVLTGWDWYNDTVFLSPGPEYGSDYGIESLIKTASSLVYQLISKKTGLSVTQVMETLRNEGKRIIYDQCVSFAPYKASRNLTRIYSTYNCIPDKYERLEDSIRTLKVLISNI